MQCLRSETSDLPAPKEDNQFKEVNCSADAARPPPETCFMPNAGSSTSERCGSGWTTAAGPHAAAVLPRR